MITQPKYAYSIYVIQKLLSKQSILHENLTRIISPNGMFTSWDDPRIFWGQISDSRIRCYRNVRPGQISHRTFGPLIYAKLETNDDQAEIRVEIGRQYYMIILLVLATQLAVAIPLFAVHHFTSKVITISVWAELFAAIGITVFAVVDKKYTLKRELGLFINAIEHIDYTNTTSVDR